MSQLNTVPAQRSHGIGLQWLLQDWLQRVTVLLTGIFLWQFALWIHEEGIGSDSMLRLTAYVLAVTAIVECLTRLHRALRLCAQWLIIGLIVWSMLDVDFSVIQNDHYWSLVRDRFFLLFPELGIAMMTWFTYQVALWFVRSKGRIFALLIVSVLAIAVRDSFSLLILWDEAVVMILSGIGMLILRHFSDLKVKAPESWSYLSEYPSIVATPIALLVMITAILGISAPNMPPIVTDPYTT